MKMTSLQILIAGLFVVLASSCGHKQSEPTQSNVTAQPEAAPKARAQATKQQKHRAPVELSLTSSGQTGNVTLSLSITAKGAIPSASARFVLPEGVDSLGQVLDRPLGSLAMDDVVTVTLNVRVPSEGAHLIAAGVDVQMAPGRKLSRSATLALGARPAPEDARTRVITLPDGHTVRVEE
jgi:hypothetical protein